MVVTRFPLAVLPTPLVAANRLTAALGCGPLLVKRDDLIGFGVAGNKARPLEQLIGAALAQGAQVLVTGGGPGSNFCAAAALAAKVAGLRCEIVLWGDPAGAPNFALAVAAGARIILTGRTDRAEVDRLAAERAAELTASGVPAVAVPRGGSTPVGALGFADAAVELAAQLAAVSSAAVGLAVGSASNSVGSASNSDGSAVPPAVGLPVGHGGSGAGSARPSSIVLPAGSGGDGAGSIRPSAIVLPVGSGGSCAGLLAGLAEVGLDVPIVGVSVSRDPESIRATVLGLAAACSDLRGSPPPRPDQLELVDARGAGFGHTSHEQRCRARLVRDTEGLLLDGTYGAQAFSVAVNRLLARPSGPVLWWHTGGLVPALAQLTVDEGAGE